MLRGPKVRENVVERPLLQKIQVRAHADSAYRQTN